MRTRIAVACRWIDGVNGTTNGILETTQRFTASGWEAHLYGERLDTQRILQAGGVPHRIPGWPWGSYLKRRIFAWQFARRASKSQFDLIIGHGDTLLQDILILHNCVHAAHEAIHGSPLPQSAGVGRIHEMILSQKRFRILIANSELMKNDLTHRFKIIPELIQVLYPSFDPNRFRGSDRQSLGPPVRQELGVGPQELLVGLITSGDFKKRGVDIFIRALARLPGDLRDKVHGLLIGKEKDAGNYRRLAIEAGLGPRMHFLPAAASIERYYHAMDIFAYPAHFEEFGQSVQEAMACGVPVLITARVGAAELLGDKMRNELLAAPDAEDFSRRLEELLRSPEMRCRWSGEGLAACRNNTWDEYFKRLLKVCEAVLPQPRSSY